MNTDERRSELLKKANKMMDTIGECMRMVENVEAAKRKFLRADAALSLEIPIQGTGGMVDVFKFADIFDERGIEKIKAYILTELEFLEEESLKILDTAGFGIVAQSHDNAPQPEELPFTPEPDADPEDDSDMIVVPEKLEKKVGRPKKYSSDKYSEGTDNKAVKKTAGRSASR